VTGLGFVPDTVHAVQLTMRARNDAETREARLKHKSGAVTEDGATQAMRGPTSISRRGELDVALAAYRPRTASRPPTAAHRGQPVA
jgi:hypothetical protein